MLLPLSFICGLNQMDLQHWHGRKWLNKDMSRFFKLFDGEKQGVCKKISFRLAHHHSRLKCGSRRWLSLKLLDWMLLFFPIQRLEGLQNLLTNLFLKLLIQMPMKNLLGLSQIHCQYLNRKHFQVFLIKLWHFGT